MREKINQEQRAYLAWIILTNYATKKSTLTYGEIAGQLNIHHRAVRFILGIIQDYCLENELPPLTILVLNKHSGLPGDGFIAYDIENSQDGINKVYAKDWTSIPNPFEYAQVGTTEHELIDSLISTPENSEDIFAKVKVRGVAQRIFRQALLKVYDYSCAICGLSFEEALQGAHIIPYSQSNAKQRLDVRNGLLLCSTHHKLFDCGYISINKDYTIHYFDKEEILGEYSKYDRLMTTDFHGKKINLPISENHLPNTIYLEIQSTRTAS